MWNLELLNGTQRYVRFSFREINGSPKIIVDLNFSIFPSSLINFLRSKDSEEQSFFGEH